MSAHTRPDTATVVLVVGVAAVALAVAVALKARCGPSPSGTDQYMGWCYTDIIPLYYVEGLDRGATPYLDHPVEYPVLTGATMAVAAAASRDVWGFWWANAVLLVAAGLGTAWLLAGEVGRRALAFAAAPTLAVSGLVNWDLLAVLLATAGLIAHRRGRDAWAGTWLGLGTAAKLYPGLFLLAVVPAAAALRGRRAAWRCAAAAVGSWAAVNIPVAVAAPEGWSRFFTLNRERPVDWDALSGVALRLGDIELSTATINVVTAILVLAGTVAILIWTLRRDPPVRWHLAALPLLAWFLLANKVYSPQYSLWLLPLVALAAPHWGWWAAFAVADVAVTATRFPYLGNFAGVAGAWPWPPFAAALVVRGLVLGGLAWSSWRRAAEVGS